MQAYQRTDVVGQQAIDLAHRLGDPAVLAFTLKAHQYSLWGRPERINELIASADEILTLAEDIGDKEKAAEAHVWRLSCSLELGNIQAVDAELDALGRLAEEMRQPFYMYLAIGFQATQALLEGRFEEAERLAQQGLAVGQRMIRGLRVADVYHPPGTGTPAGGGAGGQALCAAKSGPKAHGGIELHPVETMQVWEAVARLDASAAWNLVMN